MNELYQRLINGESVKISTGNLNKFIINDAHVDKDGNIIVLLGQDFWYTRGVLPLNKVKIGPAAWTIFIKGLDKFKESIIRRNTLCQFNMAYHGACEGKKEKLEYRFCPSHMLVKCSCGRQAIGECSYAGIHFVCGRPLCESCKCTH